MKSSKLISRLVVSGIELNDQEELRRTFDFYGDVVDDSIKDPAKLIFQPNQFKVSGDGVFYTVQGEGPTMGLPAVFLRLHVCNLKCIWCDAWYTWNPNTPEFWQESENWTIEKTKQAIEKCWTCENPNVPKRLVITGGEPLLQRDRIDLLIDAMPDWEIEIETNGTIMPSKKMLKRVQFNCSPKLRNSQNPLPARFKPEVLQALNTVNTVFKFVIMNEEDLQEIEDDFILPLQLDIKKILVMPQGVTAQEVSHNARRLVEVVKKKGFRLLGRLQCEIWGARRKV